MSEELVTAAKDILNQSIDLLEGCRKICRISADINVRRDKIFDIFVGVESETDHIPDESRRGLHSQEYLDKLDQEKAASMEFYRPEIEDGCRKIIEKFS